MDIWIYMDDHHVHDPLFGSCYSCNGFLLGLALECGGSCYGVLWLAKMLRTSLVPSQEGDFFVRLTTAQKGKQSRCHPIWQGGDP